MSATEKLSVYKRLLPTNSYNSFYISVPAKFMQRLMPNISPGKQIYFCIKLFLAAILFLPNFLKAQSPSNIVYPVASCSSGCPNQATLPTYITASYFDTINEVLYIGGRFNDLSSATRNGLAAIDAITGNLLPWNPIVNNGEVRCLAKSGDTIFVGGTFTQLNSQTRNRIAAISASTGNNFPTFLTGTSSANDTVTCFEVLGNKIYVGGKFTNIASSARNNIACLDFSGNTTTWAPVVSGVTRKFSRYTGNIVALCDDVPNACNKLYCITTASGITTVRVTPDPGYLISDFAMRGNVAFVVGPFQIINSQLLNYAAAVDMTTGVLTAWNPTIPIFNWDTRSKFNIEYYRDSLFIGVFDATSQQPAYHQLYVSYYNSPNNIRVLKTYQSNLIGLNGYYNDNLLVGNARLIEIERFAQHTSFPFGTISDRFFSYCLKPPNQPGPFTIFPTPVCPGDSNVTYRIVSLGYFNNYIWMDNNANVTEAGTTISCSADFNENFSGSVAIRVYGVTSCGTQSSAFRTTTVFPKPVPDANAGLDDTLSCITTQLMLHATSITPGATFAWDGPSGSSGTDSLLANVPGNYQVIVHGPNGCWKRDTTTIGIDTVRPALVPFGNVPTLTCRDTISILDASGIYPGDSLFWSGPGLISPDNPASVNQSTNYLLTITSRNNGCFNSDTIYVPQNFSPPQASIISSDTILTCSIQQIQLDGNSSNSNVTYQWSDTSGTFFANPYIISIPGVYQLHATDTTNGCVNSADLIYVNSWTTPPGINPLADSLFLNCSYSSLPLNASSLTIGAGINWSGPNNYSSVNPGTATQLGYYVATVSHPANGCISLDSVYVNFQMTLDVNASNDTAICPGSGAVINSFPIGGTAPFNFAWNNSAGNNSSEIVFPNDTLSYIVTVTDAAGCTGGDTVIVNVPDPIADSTLSFQPCDPNHPTGQIQIYAYNGVPPFQYSSDNGLSWNTTGVFPNLNYGAYSFLIRDFLGCEKNETAAIDTNSLSPSPEFLISTSPQQGDTIVAVDISNPRPDSVRWDFPANSIVTDSNMFAPAFILTDTGAFALTMHAYYGTCEVVLSHNSSTHPFDSLNATPWNNNGIDTIVVYPNPNNGTFNLDVTLFSKQNFVILVYDASGVEQTREQVYDAENWSGQISVPNPVPGNYVLKVIAPFDSDQKVFVISQ